MLPLLEAEQQLRAIEAASVPQMKDDARRAVFDRYARVIERSTTGRAKTAHEALLAAGIPVVYKPGRKATGRAGKRRRGKA
jgi:hypothetical protein